MTEAALPDGELARRIHGASPGAASAEEAELCARLARRLRLYGLRHLGDESAAADLVQRVLLLMVEKLRGRQVREPERIASFALGTARRVSREMIRGGRREVPLPDGASELPAAGREAEPLGEERLARCLEALLERERTVVLLTFYQEEAPAKIAQALGATEGNVRVLRHRALRRLRGCMGLGGEEAS